MSKRCKLQKEYYQQYGNYKGNGKYSDEYVSWLEEQILALRIHDVVGRSEQLICDWCKCAVDGKICLCPDCRSGMDGR